MFNSVQDVLSAYDVGLLSAVEARAELGLETQIVTIPKHADKPKVGDTLTGRAVLDLPLRSVVHLVHSRLIALVSTDRVRFHDGTSAVPEPDETFIVVHVA